MRRAIQDLGNIVPREGLADAERALNAHERDGADLIGARVGDFEIVERLGAGGMGEVFVATQISVPGRRVALKTLPGLAASPVRRMRFAREVEVIGRLDHPNIVPIFTADLDASTPYFAMKLVEGEPLHQRLRGQDWNAQDFRAIAEMVRDLALALHHAHEHGVVHRDVKPGNIVIDTDGRPMLLDFGLARDTGEDSDLTLSSDAVGTQNYMAPEQVDPRRGTVDARTDVYGLGATLYECLVGRPPFASESRAQTLTDILDGNPTAPRKSNRGVPVDLETICLEAIECAPNRRYQSAADFAEDLTAFLEFRPIAAAPPSTVRKTLRAVRRHRVLLALCVVAVVALGASTWYWRVVAPAQRVEELLGVALPALEQRSAARAEVDARQAELDAQLQLPPRSWTREARARLESRLEAAILVVRGLDLQLERALDAAVLEDPDEPRVRKTLSDFAATKLQEDLENVREWLRNPNGSRWNGVLAKYEPKHPLLHRSGRLVLSCKPGPMRVWLCPAIETDTGVRSYAGIAHPDSIDLGTTPIDGEAPEGSYFLHGVLDGHADLGLPLLVRRAAVQRDREREIELQPMPSSHASENFRYVHAGYSVLGRDEIRNEFVNQLTWVDGFEIGTHELQRYTLRDLMDVARIGERSALSFLRSEPAFFQGRVVLPSYVAMHAILDEINDFARTEDPARRVYRLPTPTEWERAARGADARRFVWGDSIDWQRCMNHWYRSDDNHGVQDKRTPDGDVSPFGVHDLAGVLSEPCLPHDYVATLGLRRLILRGGSILSRSESEVSIHAEDTQDYSFIRGETGLRIVRVRPRPIPKGPREFRDDFDSSSPIADTPWRTVAQSGHLIDTHGARFRFRFVDGKLLVEGFAGPESPKLLAWRPLTFDPVTGSRTISARVRVWSEILANQPGEASIEIGTDPRLRPLSRVLACSVTRHGATLGIDGTAAQHERLDIGTDWIHIRLTIRSGDVEAVIRREHSDGPEIARLRGKAPDDLRDICYLGLRTNNSIAPRTEWDFVEVREP